MREERTDLDCLEDIQDADDKTVFAVIRAFEILGKAEKSSPQVTQADSLTINEIVTTTAAFCDKVHPDDSASEFAYRAHKVAQMKG